MRLSPAPYDLHARLSLSIHIENDIVAFFHHMQVRNLGINPRHVGRQLDTERYSSPTVASPSDYSANGPMAVQGCLFECPGQPVRRMRPSIAVTAACTRNGKGMGMRVLSSLLLHELC